MTTLGKAQTPKHENLAEAFGGALTRTARPAQENDSATAEQPEPQPAVPAPPAVSEPAGEPTSTEDTSPIPAAKPKGTKPSTATRPTARAASPAPPRAAASTQREKADKAISVSLRVSLHDRLDRFKRDTGLSYPNIVLSAISAKAQQLPELIAAATVSVGDDSVPDLFDLPKHVMPRNDAPEAKKELVFRVSEKNKDVLNQLEHEFGAPNRTALISVALDAYLPQ